MKRLILVLMSISLISILPSSSYASNWQELTIFSGQSTKTTDYFFVPTKEWRLTYNCTPISESWGFNILICRKDGGAIQYVYATQNQSSDTTYVHVGAEFFYLSVGAAYVNYTITIEYDTTAPVPEFPSLLILSALMIIIPMIAVAYKKRMTYSNRTYSKT